MRMVYLKYFRGNEGRAVAANSLLIYEKENIRAERAYEMATRGLNLERRERAFSLELAMGTIRRKLTLDFILSKFISRSIEQVDPSILSVLRTGAYQMFFMNSVPNYSAVDESVKLIKCSSLSWAAGFVNATLRKVANVNLEDEFASISSDINENISLKTSFPEWIVRHFAEEHGYDNAKRICECSNESPKIFARLNRLRGNFEEVMNILREDEIELEAGEYLPESAILTSFASLDKLSSFNKGCFSIQDESSMFVARALHPEENFKILDVCSAPGGKTTHVAELCNDLCEIIACDVSEERLKLVDESAKRLGLSSVKTQVCDGRWLPEEYYGSFDAVLVDAPCSGLGVLSRRADSRYRKRKEDIEKLSSIQSDILESASKCVKSGGTLIYSTCTIAKKENEKQIEKFLKTHSNFIGTPLYPHFSNLRKPIIGLKEEDYSFQFLPYIHNIDGFFIARIKRL